MCQWGSRTSRRACGRHPFAASDRLTPPTPEPVRTRIKKLRDADHSVTVLAVSVFGSSYAEAAESRRRTRYAVVAALGFYDYLPDNPEAIGYFRIGLPEPDGRPLKLTVPYEWFGHRRSDVLVLWLNEDKLLPSPKEKLDKLFKDLTARSAGTKRGTSREVRDSLSLRMVGPAGSDMLVELVRDFATAMSGFNHDVETLKVFAPGATISNCELFWAARRQAGLQRAALPEVPREWSKYCFVHDDARRDLPAFLREHALVRTTGTDDVLAAALLWELAQHGINRQLVSPDLWYQRTWTWLSGRRERESSAHVCEDGLVLINEWDTEYGRALLRHLSYGFSERCQPEATGDNHRATRFTRPAETPYVRQFNYLRGLDGALPDLDKLGDGAPAKDDGDKAKDLRAQLNDVPREYAEGRSQFDYLRRLADEIARLDGDPRFAQNGVRAIGIVGSDVYDKLLILQALRGRFKNKIFFTTDLDARYLHADQKDWARNLVVASNFGLSLRPALQQATPPFRDSYQTATYLAALMALDDTQVADWSGKISEWLRPQLFEIGRTEAVQLASPSAAALAAWIKGENPAGMAPAADDAACSGDLKDCGNIEPAWTRQSTPWTLVLAISLPAIGLTVLTSRRVQGMVQAAIHGPDRATPTLAGAMAIGLAALVLVAVALVDRALDTSLKQGVGEPFVWLEGVSVWPSLVLRFAGLVTTIALATAFVISMRRQTWLIAERFMLGTPPSWRLTRNWWSAAWSGPHLDLASFDTVGKPGTKTTAVKVDILWQNYLRATSPRAMWPWMVLSILLVFMLGGLAFQLLGRPAFPHRGDLVWTLHRALVFSATGALWLVIFWVGYEARAGARFIQTLSDAQSVWPRRLLKCTEKVTGVPRAYLADYLDFQLIVAVTSRIHGLIYLPFVSILFPVIARNDLFDATDFPLALMFVTGLALGYALYTAVLLRRSAEAARATALAHYETRLLAQSRPKEGPRSPGAPEHVAGAPDPAATPEPVADTPLRVSTEQIRLLMDQIRGIRKGAFAPFAQQPAVQALLLPFGGYGSAQLITYLINF